MQKVVDVRSADGSEFLSIATYLPVRNWRDVLAFLRMARRVEQQIRGSDGIIRYGLKTDLPRKRFWTYSVWKHRQLVGPFVAAEPHATAVRMFGQWAGRGAAFVEWTGPDAAIDWAEANRRLKAPTFYYQR